MKYPLQLTISNPCDQDWNEMQPKGMDRNCAHCQKTVIDFTYWSDVALYEFLASSQTKVCGRFLKTQVGRPIDIPHQPHSKLYRLTIALGLTLIFSHAPEARAQNRPPKAQQTLVNQNAPHTNTMSKKKLDSKAKVIEREQNHPVNWGRPTSMITGEVDVKHVVKRPDSMSLVPVPSMLESKKTLSPRNFELDINNPTKKVFKRE